MTNISGISEKCATIRRANHAGSVLPDYAHKGRSSSSFFLIPALVALAVLLLASASQGQQKGNVQLQIVPGHPWRPPFGIERVGQPLEAVVKSMDEVAPAGEFVLVGYQQGKEVSRQRLLWVGTKSVAEKDWKPPYYARAGLGAWPSEVVLLFKSTSAAAPVELARQRVTPSLFEAEAIAQPDKVINPVDLGTILVPADWLLLAGGQKAVVQLAAVSRSSNISAGRAMAWYASAPQRKVVADLPLNQDQKARVNLTLGSCSTMLERDTLHVAIDGAGGKVLWQKDIRVMIVPKVPNWPEFGAVRTKLRYDAPILSVIDEKYTSMNYETAWLPQLQDLVVFFPNGARWVSWRGSNYIPFWAGRYNTGLCYEWAERISPNEGFTDCPEPLMDKELRYSRVTIMESTPARVHVRWNYQSCDFKYRVNGDLPVEDYYFYPDGFGTRNVTLTSIPEAQYELQELIILTPQGALPLDVLPSNLLDVLPLGSEKVTFRFPFLMEEQETEWKKADNLPAVYRLRPNRQEVLSAISFCPNLTVKPWQPYAPFYDQGVLVTPLYWGSHWPLSRGCNTGWTINDRISLGPAHNSTITWGSGRPEPVRSATVETRDGLGQVKTMKVQSWVWLIGMTDAGDETLVEWAKSFAQPPELLLQGARRDLESYVLARRALPLIVEKNNVSITIEPKVQCINPVFELKGAPGTPLKVTLGDQVLGPQQYAWDGKTLWLNARINQPTRLQLEFRKDIQ